jgi:hypothetical protein
MAKMPYYEIQDHEMNCLKGVRDFSGSNTVQSMPLHHGLPTDCYTLVIPKVSPSVRMNISINNHESKIGNREDKRMHDKKTSNCDNKSSTVWHNKSRKIRKAPIQPFPSIELVC